MPAHDLRAPSADGGLLAVPPLEAVPALLAEDRARLSGWSYDVQGRPADRLRALARRQVLEAAASYHRELGLEPVAPDDDPEGTPLLVTGHQPELFHPGVWAKNFALDAMARRSGGRALNLIVDNDVPRSPSIRVPTAAATPDGLRVLPVEFDVWGGELPFEEWRVRDESCFASFPDRVRRALGGLVADPVLDAFWPHVREASGRTDRIGLRFAAARRALEGEWGVHNAEVPLGAVCETEAFAWFAAHLLAQLPRFQAVHNAALASYRALYGIRSTHHPVPALEEDRDGWRESPFWAWRALGGARRRPLLARQADARTVQLRIAGEAAPFAELPLGPDREACCAVDRLLALPAEGIRLRTRALTTTMFGRLLLGDLFLHGIGGAKYDELGDAVIRGFFGIEPPGYATLSLTVHLGLPVDPGATPEARRAAWRRLRELTHQPERHLPAGAADALIAAKREALAGPQATRRQRRGRRAELRRVTAALAAPLAGERERLRADLAAIDRGLAANARARGRDFAFVLHGRGRLRAALAAMLR
jgi:hypothetical protein